MALLNRQTVLVGIVALVLLPVVTYYLTSALFHRRILSKSRNKVPPTVPYQVPGVFHAFSLATVGPQKYLAQLIKDYGDFGPFFVKAGPQSFLIVCDPEHVDKVCAASRHIPPSASRLEVLDKLYGLPASALDLYAGKVGSDADEKSLEYARFTLVDKYLTGPILLINVEKYVSILSENLRNKMFQVGSWTQIEDTWAFFQQVATRCILVSLFGDDLVKQYPGILKDFWEFNDAAEGFIPGLPRYWVPGAATQIRERLQHGIEKWLKANLSGSESARIADEDPMWDEWKGSKFIQERDQVLSKIDIVETKTRAADLLNIMHESLSTMVPCIIWSLLEVTRGPQFANELITGLSSYSPSHDATYNVQDIAGMPLMESLLAETVRLRTAAIEVLNSKTSFALDEHWTVPADTCIVAMSHELALCTNAWGNARAQTIVRPLEEFWPERFLVQGNSDPGLETKVQRSNVRKLSFSMEGLNSLNITMGCGQRPMLGREHLKQIHAATMAVLFNEFEIQLCDPELFDVALPPVREAAFGMLRPLEKIAIRIRKRSTSK